MTWQHAQRNVSALQFRKCCFFCELSVYKEEQNWEHCLYFITDTEEEQANIFLHQALLKRLVPGEEKSYLGNEWSADCTLLLICKYESY